MTRPVSDFVTFKLQVSFNTPAFLGNAEQAAQWRTPPFKALLRQWWRVGRAASVGYDHRRLLEAESRLFGTAGEKGSDAGRSLVQIRLSRWDAGSGTRLPRVEEVRHPEVNHHSMPAPPGGQSGRMVGSLLYLGFGPVTVHKTRSFIEPGESAQLHVRVRREHAEEIEKAIQLAAWFGTLGSRSRNGWGSVQIAAEPLKTNVDPTDADLSAAGVLRPLSQALGDRLASDWGHAVAQDSQGRACAWRVFDHAQRNPDGTGSYQGFESWRDAMVRLARIRIGVRTQFKFNSGKPHDRVEDRHILAYPVTNHDLRGKQDARLANQLCFKVIKQVIKRKDSDAQADRYLGLIYHTPHTMPAAFFAGRDGLRPGAGSIQKPSLEQQLDVWGRVHAWLDGVGTRGDDIKLVRIRKG